jgi:glycosyltransferase involved in cell wall biosynthesis
VAQAIQSVFAQTYPRIELLIVDDGSTDSSRSVIRKTLAARPRNVQARFFTRKNGGAHAAINYGLKRSHGSYLTILNSDDYYHPERIETLLRTSQTTGAELLFSLVEMVSEQGEPLSASTPEVLWYHEAVSHRHYLPTLGFALIRDNLAVTSGNLFFARTLLDRVGPFAGYKYAHDADFVLRSIPHTEPRLVSRKLLSYRLHGNNTIRATGSSSGTEAEGRHILGRYMKSALENGPKENRFAPCPAYWPRYFNRFLSTERPFFGECRIADYLEESGDVSVRPSTREPIGAAQQFQTAPGLTGVNVHLVDRAKAPVGPYALHSSRTEEHSFGRKLAVKVIPSALPGGHLAPFVALVHEDTIVATTQLGPAQESGAECSFIVSSEFAGLELRNASFLPLEGSIDTGFVLHSGTDEVFAPRLDWGRGPRLEPQRLHLGSQAYEIRAAAFNGQLERLRLSPGGDLIAEGWAVDPVSREPLMGVVLFDGNKLVPCRYQTRFRRAIEGLTERSGFQVTVPAASLRGSDKLDLRAVAIFKRGIALSLGRIIRDSSPPGFACHLPWEETPADVLARVERTRTGWKFREGQAEHEWSLQPASAKGWIDHVDLHTQRGVIAGWAVDPISGQAPQAFLVCEEDTPLAFLRPNWERPDIARGFSLREPLIAGVRITLPRDRFPSTIRGYALWESGVATEVPLLSASRNVAKPAQRSEAPAPSPTA